MTLSGLAKKLLFSSFLLFGFLTFFVVMVGSVQAVHFSCVMINCEDGSVLNRYSRSTDISRACMGDDSDDPFVKITCVAMTPSCNTNEECADFRTEQGWKGVRCVGGVEDAEKQAGRCIEAPAAGTDLPKGPQKAGEILDLLDLVTDWIFAIAMAVALIYLVLAGFQFVTGGGDPIKVTQARQKLIYAIIGIGVALISAGFIATLRWLIA